MQTISTIGLDIAKSVFQVHRVDAAGQVVVRRQLKRRHVLAFFQKLPQCLVGIEACASAHHRPDNSGHNQTAPAFEDPGAQRLGVSGVGDNGRDNGHGKSTGPTMTKRSRPIMSGVEPNLGLTPFRDRAQ